MAGPTDLVIFDLDGTLVDSLPDIASALNHVLGSSGRPPLPVSEVGGLVGEGVLRLTEKALERRPGPPADAQALAGELMAFYRAHPCVNSRPYDGVVATLDALREAGRRLAVLTNKPGEIARSLLGVLGLAEGFEAVIGDGDGPARKPDARAARALLDRLAVPASRALMVGDGLPDLQVARAAGLASAAALWGYTDADRLLAERPDYVLRTPSDLLGIVAR